MGHYIKEFSDLILSDRGWSWSVMGILYLGLTLVIRNWFVRPIFARAKELKRNSYGKFKEYYLKNSIPGWLFYLLSLAIILILWSQPVLIPLTGKQALALLTAFACYVLSILIHVQAVGLAAVLTLKSIETDSE